MAGKRYGMHDLEKLRKPAQILADEIDRIANIGGPTEIVVSKAQFSMLLDAVGERTVVRIVLESYLPKRPELEMRCH